LTEFQITNPILQAAMFGNHYCENSKLIAHGYINNDKYKLARAFLSYCTEVIFNIRRLPGFEEDYRFSEARHYFEAFSVLDHADMTSAIAELKALYEHTQACLTLDTNVSNGKLKVRRSLAFFERKQVTIQLLEEKDSIEYYSNIISSYKSFGGLYEYGSPILLTREVDIKDILMHYKYLKYPGNVCSGESREFEILVVNSDPFGREVFNRSNFKYDSDRFSYDEKRLEQKFNYYHLRRLQDVFINLETIEDTYCQRPLLKQVLKAQRLIESLLRR